MPPSPDERYDWLYDAPRDSSQLPPPDLPAPGTATTAPPPPRPPKRFLRRVRRLFSLVILVLLAWAAYLVAVPAYAWTTVSSVDATPAGARPAEQPGRTYLIVGSDSRRGLSPSQRRQLKTGPDLGSARTDTIMLMHVGAGPTLLLSIPRDSLLDVPGYGRTKVNAAYAYGGPKLLVQTLEDATGVRIDDYIEIGFGGLVNVVDAVGGIEICPTSDITDPLAGLSIKAGCQWVDGPTALGYSRSRHTYITQDIQRVQAQREVISAIADEVNSPWTLLDPMRYWNTVMGGARSVQVGESTGLTSMAQFAVELARAMTGNGLSCTVPLADFTVRWDRERALALFAHVKNDETARIGDLCTKDGLKKD